jgi:hypothetical protein
VKSRRFIYVGVYRSYVLKGRGRYMLQRLQIDRFHSYERVTAYRRLLSNSRLEDPRANDHTVFMQLVGSPAPPRFVFRRVINWQH